MSFALHRLCLRAQTCAHSCTFLRQSVHSCASSYRGVPQRHCRLLQLISDRVLHSKGFSRRFRSPPQPAVLQQTLSTVDRSSAIPVDAESLEWDEPAVEPVVELVLPPPTNTKVKTAEFVKSSTAISQCPGAGYPEFAVIGRSNVGKSSLINMITGRKALAQISKTPGKTVCINHFVINNSWYLVDLPGYGYAKRSKDLRLVWNEFTKDYLLNRETLVNVLLLVDSSIPPTQLDLTCADWLAGSQVPFTLVFTKLDKRKKGSSSEQNMKAFKAALQQEWEHLPFILETSAVKGSGRQEVMAHIASLRTLWQQEH